MLPHACVLRKLLHADVDDHAVACHHSITAMHTSCVLKCCCFQKLVEKMNTKSEE